MSYRTLQDISCEGKRVLVRCDLNVPLRDGSVADEFRLKALLPTLRTLLDADVKQLVLMSHLGRPKGVDKAYSLKPVAEHLATLLGERVDFAPDCTGPVPDSRIVVLENLRFHEGEKKNDAAFAKELAKHGDVYVNDAFGTMHRAHASVVGVPELFEEKCVGLLVEKELKGLDFTETERPFVAVMGAAKIGDKIGLLERLLNRVDTLLLGGGIVFTFLKAQGYEVGTSILEEEHIPKAKQLLDSYREKIMLPVDIVISEEVQGADIFTVDVEKIPPDMKGLDVGDATVEQFCKVADTARTVFWNGPLGMFETPPFDTATNALAGHLAKSSARIVVGGGDTAAAVEEGGWSRYYAHVSTGGGASLQYVAGETLPGLEALRG